MVILMNETIGVKGGANDRKRRLRITKKQKAKLRKHQEDESKKELEKLEKKVRHIQRITLVKTLPIVITGGVIKTIYETSQKKPPVNKEEVFSQTNLKEYDADVTNVEKRELAPHQTVTIYTDKLEKALSERTIEEKVELDYTLIPKEANHKEEILKEANQKDTTKSVEVITQEEIPLPSTELPLNSDELETLKTKKIIENYESQLNETRRNLRETNFLYTAYNNKEDSSSNDIIDGISTIIQRVGVLKEKIQSDTSPNYDENYLDFLVEQYIEEIKTKGYSKDLEDSEIYSLLSQKISEANDKNESLDEKVNIKSDELLLQNIDLEALKEKYYNYEKFNTQLLEFQNEQDYLLKQIREKMAHAVSIEEKVKIEAQAMNKQSKRLLNLLALQMFLPGPRSAKGLATAAATYLYFINNVINPKYKTKKYKVINVKDYSKEIEQSLNAISDINNLVHNTSKEIDRTISRIKREFKDYIDIVPECANLITDLEKIKESIKEKDYEISTIEKEQRKNLEKNNAKVLKYQKQS